MIGVGEMLRLARQRLGLTQKIAAEKLGIPQPVLSRYENSVSDPDEAILLRAGRVYDVPRAFFDLREPVYGPPVSVHPMPRAKSDVTARDLDMVTAELNIRVMQMRRFLDSVDFEPTADLPSLDIEAYGTPDDIANTVRTHWKVPPGPVRNLTGLAERAGVIVGTSEFGGASISGMTFKVPGQPPLVLLNAHHPADRLRFTLAHEIGHLVMHRFPTPTMEDEANDFASALLMPATDITSGLRGRRITLELLAAMKPEWRVAMQAIAMRAKKLGFLNENQARYIFQQISARGWRTREPAELDFSPEAPTVLRSIINNHIDVLGFSLPDLCNFVPLYEREFVRMYGPLGGNAPPRPRLRLVT